MPTEPSTSLIDSSTVVSAGVATAASGPMTKL